MEKYYECRKCKKTYSRPHLNDWLCLECRLLQLRMVYEKKRAATLTKKKLTDEIRKLRTKCEKIFAKEEETDESNLSDRISSDDNKEEDYVPPTPQTTMTAKRKIFVLQSQSSSTSKKKKVPTSSTQIPALSRQTQTTPETTKTPIKETQKYVPLKHVNFQKYYKGPKRYYPDATFNYHFEHIEKKEERKYLMCKLEQKKQAIKTELDKLFRGKSYAISGTTRKFPCILDKSCTFLGSKLSRHCKSKLHDTTENQGRFLESFLNHSVQYITLVIKAGSRKPTLCVKCEMFYERITSHMQHQHKLKPGTPSFIKTLEQNKTRTQEWIEEVYQAYQASDECTDSTENEEPEPKKARIQKDPEDQNTEEGDDNDAEEQKEKNNQSEKKKEKKDKGSEKKGKERRKTDKGKKDKEMRKDQEKKDNESEKKQEKKDKENGKKSEEKDKETLKTQEQKDIRKWERSQERKIKKV